MFVYMMPCLCSRHILPCCRHAVCFLSWLCVNVVLSMQLTLQMKDENKSSDQDSNSESQQGQQDREHDKAGEQKGEESSQKDSCYTFSLTETTILEVVMDAMRTCGLALALQALSTVLLGRMQKQHCFL